jgi:hypothetical protein
VLRVPALRTVTPVALIHRRRAFHGGATKALIAALTAWPAGSRDRRPSPSAGARRRPSPPSRPSRR